MIFNLTDFHCSRPSNTIYVAYFRYPAFLFRPSIDMRNQYFTLFYHEVICPLKGNSQHFGPQLAFGLLGAIHWPFWQCRTKSVYTGSTGSTLDLICPIRRYLSYKTEFEITIFVFSQWAAIFSPKWAKLCEKGLNVLAKSINSCQPAQADMAGPKLFAIFKSFCMSENDFTSRFYLLFDKTNFIESIIALRFAWYNPFPNKLRFLRVCSASLLKTLWKKEKLLVPSNFSFSHSVF